MLLAGCGGLLIGGGHVLVGLLLCLAAFTGGLLQYAKARVDLTNKRIFEAWRIVGSDLLMTIRLQTAPECQQILDLGSGFEKHLGWSRQELLGQNWRSFCHPDDLEAAQHQMLGLLEGRSVQQFTVRWRHKNGHQWVWLEWNAIADKQLGLLFAHARDLTHYFEHEAQMATWSRLTSDLMAVGDLSDPIETRCFAWVNDAWARELGWDLAKLYDTPILDLLHADELDQVVARRQDREQNPQPGETRRFECKVRAPADKHGQVTYKDYEWVSTALNHRLYATGRDITGVKEQRAKLAALIQDLQDRNADLERFASVAAHQLRSPPRTISGMATALIEDYGDQLGEEGVQYLQDIQADATQMADIVSGLYRFSKIRTSEDITAENVNLDKLMVDLYRTKKKRGDLKPEWSLVWDELPVVKGDKLLLTEVLTNLIDNGFKFNEAQKRKVAIRYAALSDTRVQIMVADNGIGIDPRYKGKLFTMFQRLHQQYPGTGVGLALVAAIVSKHGGSIEVDSAPGRGSVFRFDLPLATLDDLRPDLNHAPTQALPVIPLKK